MCVNDEIRKWIMRGEKARGEYNGIDVIRKKKGVEGGRKGTS